MTADNINGMPRHNYVPADPYYELPAHDNCWFEFHFQGHLTRCRSTLADHVKYMWDDPERAERLDEGICGVDMSHEEEPGHYICDEKVGAKFGHHYICGQHHDPEKISCEATAELMAIDEEMLRRAR